VIKVKHLKDSERDDAQISIIKNIRNWLNGLILVGHSSILARDLENHLNALETNIKKRAEMQRAKM